MDTVLKDTEGRDMEGGNNRNISRRVNILQFVLVLSLLLNVSVLVSAGYTHYKQTYYRVSPFVNGVWKPNQQVPGHLFEKLSLRPEQLKTMQQRAFVFHGEIERKEREISQRLVSLVTLMRADSPDNKAVDAVITEINRLQQDVQKTAVSHMLEFKGMLYKEQQKQFLDLMEREMAGASRLGGTP